MRHIFWKNPGVILVNTESQNIKEKLFRTEFPKAMEVQDNLGHKKAKRYRSAFTTEQVNYLEKQFRKFPYIGNAHRKEVANILNIPERAVKIWFQNRRMKEKKEAINKEQDCDDQTGHKNVEFTNDQLNNVRASPSVNEQCLKPLPLLTSFEETEVKENNGKEATGNDEVKSKESQKINFYTEISPKQVPFPMDNAEYEASSPVLKHRTVPCYRSTAEFSIDLCKRYRNELQKDNNNHLQKLQPNTQVLQPMTPIKQDIDAPLFNQNVPEDLSYTKPQSRSTPPNNVQSTNLGFQPFYVANYAQPYLPAGNMLWKPVNVMPIMSTGAPITVSNNLAGSIPITQDLNVPKKTCTCDCHMKVPGPVNFGENHNPHAQYIITAVPLQNYPKF